MGKKIIVKIAAGLGNQMFMYAHAYALSKELNYKLYIDDSSGYFQKKNRTFNRKYRLTFFKLSSSIIEKKYKFDNYFTHNIKKFLKFFDIFKKKKSFFLEHEDKKKITFFKKNSNFLSDKIYIEGYFQSEKYFSKFKNDLYREFTVKDDLIDSNNKYIDMLKNSNSVSIHIRRGRFFEPKEFSNRGSMPVKEINLKDVFDYIYKSISFFEKNTINPKFFVWSNDFTDLDKFFNNKKFVFIRNNNTAMDFHLFKFAKHFIVGPSSFHWWAAWLNPNKEKICVRPPNFIKPANNIDFWPENWKEII
tara:strand:- start:321 stop:1232 length:912 start_codon:yes stop_codon:yes gene_type:complete